MFDFLSIAFLNPIHSTSISTYIDVLSRCFQSLFQMVFVLHKFYVACSQWTATKQTHSKALCLPNDYKHTHHSFDEQTMQVFHSRQPTAVSMCATTRIAYIVNCVYTEGVLTSIHIQNIRWFVRHTVVENRQTFFRIRINLRCIALR